LGDTKIARLTHRNGAGWELRTLDEFSAKIR
jgi:hypothetical protein